MAIHLLNSELSGLKVLIVGKDERVLLELETQSENDPSFARVELLSATSITKAREILKTKYINLVVYENYTENRDFVYLQKEFLHISKSVWLVPLIDDFSLDQIRELNRNGQIIDYSEAAVFKSYKDFSNLILGTLRSISSFQSLSKMIQYVRPIAKAIQICKPVNYSKIISKEIISELLCYYDFSTFECQKIIASESLFSPWISIEQYRDVLKNDEFNLLANLEMSGSWNTEIHRSPNSSSGFIITFSNFISSCIEKKLSPEEVIKLMNGRPTYLKHPSILVCSERIVKSIMQSNKYIKEAI